MKCSICKFGETKKGKTTVTLERKDTIIVIKGVPADICDNCGEYYLSEEVTAKILEMAEQAINNKVEVEVLKYIA